MNTIKDLQEQVKELREGLSDCQAVFSKIASTFESEGHGMFSGTVIEIRTYCTGLDSLLERTK